MNLMSLNTRSTNDAQQQTILTIEPNLYEQPTMLIYSGIHYNEDELKLIVYSRCRVVKWLAMIDMIFLTFSFVLSVLSGSFYWIYLILFPFCICGYNGALKYKKNQVLVYDLYLLGIIILYFYTALHSKNFLWFVFVFLESYFFYYTSRLILFLNSLPEEIMESLQSGWNPTALTFYFY